MADRKPLKVLPDSASGTGGGDSTGIGEFVAGDTLGIIDGGTGLATVATSNILTGNGTSALSAESNLTFTGSALTCIGTMTVGVDDTGHDVKFFGATSGKYMEWDESADQLNVLGTTLLNSGSTRAIAEFTSSNTNRMIVVSADTETANDTAGIAFNATASSAIGSTHSMAAIEGKVTQAGTLKGDLVFHTNAGDSFSESMRIDSSGDVGIGNDDPDSAAPTGSNNPKILKVGGGGTSDAVLQLKGYSDDHGLDLWSDVSVGNAYIDQRGDHANYSLRFRTRTTGTPVDAMIISGTGDVSIGDGDPTYRLDVYENVADRIAEITNESASGDVLALTYRNVAPDNNDRWFLKCDDSSANRMKVFSDGDVQTADAGTLTSDERLKTNIVDASDKLADLMRLKVRNYEWTPEYHPNKVGEKKIGFIAQELETVFPALISEHDIAADNSIKEELYTADDDIPEGKAIGDVKVEAKDHEPTMRKSYKNAFVPILVKALQEVTTRLEAAEAKITALESA